MAEGAPPSPQMVHNADLELTMRAAPPRQRCTPCGNTNGLTDLNAMADAFGAERDELVEGLSPLNAMEASATHEQLRDGRQLQRSRRRCRTTHADREAARAESAGCALRELMSRDAAEDADRSTSSEHSRRRSSWLAAMEARQQIDARRAASCCGSVP